MDIALWVLQAILALAFLMAGSMKASQPLPKLAERMTWVRTTPPALVRFIGVAELLGGIGLILPEATHILSWLTPTAAIALGVVMVLAAVFHLSRRDEASHTMPSVVLLVLLVVVIIGRFALVPA